MADLSADLYGPAKSSIPPSPTLPDHANLDYYNSLPEHVKPMVNALIEGRMPSTGRNGMDKNVMTQLIGIANTIDPTFDASVFNARNKTNQDFSAGGATGKKLGSISTAMKHLQIFEQDYNKLNNRDFGGTYLNSAENSLKSLYDPKLQGAIGSTQADVNGLAGELANAFRSTGMSERDIKEQRELLSTNATPSSTKGSLESTVKLLEGKFQPQVDSYNRTMGTNKTVSDFMSPDAKLVYDRINNGKALQPPVQTIASPTKTVVQTGMYGGKKVNKYSDGSTGYAN